MDIVNPTTETIRLEFDSIPYTFEAGEATTVSDEAGAHLIHHGKRLGLVAVKWGMHPKRVALEGLKERLHWMKGQLVAHDQMNALQAEKKFPPIPETDSLRLFRLSVPEYEAKIKELEGELGIEDDSARRERMQRSLGTVPGGAIPGIEELPLEELRKVAEERHIDYNRFWGRNVLLAAIQKHMSATA